MQEHPPYDEEELQEVRVATAEGVLTIGQEEIVSRSFDYSTRWLAMQ
jgi:hypothetical protein